MDGHRLQNHLEEIDEFVSHYLDAATAVKPEILMGGQVDVEEMLKYGGFPPSDPRSRGIEGMIISGKAPCVFLRGKSRHYTVISGYTPSSLRLFDSFGYHRVLRRSCGTAGTPGTLHRFHVQSIIALTAP